MRLGIDFGTSYTRMAAFSANGLICSSAGWPGPIPSILGYSPATGRIFFGTEAMELEQPDALLWPGFKPALWRSPQLAPGSLDFEYILTAFFTFLKEQWPEMPDDPIEAVTLSVPGYLGIKAQHSLYAALQKGFAGAAIALLPGPAAALTGYQALHPGQDIEGDILIIDIGEAAADFSIISTAGNGKQLILETQSQMGGNAFCGAEVDKEIIREILKPLFHQLKRPDQLPWEAGLSPADCSYWIKLKRMADTAKTELGRHHQAVVNMIDILPGMSGDMIIDPVAFTAALGPLWERLDSYVKTVLQPRVQSLGLYDSQGWRFDHILLLGGASHTPGVLQRIKRLFPGVPVWHGQTDQSYEAVGNCLWSSGSRRLYTVCPFKFYIEKKSLSEERGRQLELIPFDTANLELDLTGTYRIFSLPVQSDYNLASSPGDVEIKIYALPDQTNAIQPEKVSGQNMVLHWQEAYYNGAEVVHIDFDLASSQLLVNFTNNLPGCPEAELFFEWPLRQLSQAHWLSGYKHVDRDLLKALQRQLQANQSDGATPYSNQLMATYYKLLCVLQILNP